LNSSDGKISNVKIFSDSLFPVMIDEVKEALQNANYDKKGIETALQNAKKSLLNNPEASESAKHVQELQEWLIQVI